MNAPKARAPRVLVTNEDGDIRRRLAASFKREGFEPLEARDAETALRIIRQELVDAVVLDTMLPDKDGVEVLREAKRFDPRTPIILVTRLGGTVSPEDAMSNGAYDCLTKPFKMDDLVFAVREAVRKHSLKKWCHSHRSPEEDGVPLCEIMGSSNQMRQVIAAIELVAPTDFTVLIMGGTGSGKEVVAKAIHRLSSRGDAPFVPVDCGSIPATLIESELFGHEKGSYTGADRSQPGKFEIASQGTLFLDEVSNLPLPVQPKLLRALQERTIWRLGSTKPIEVGMRVVAATNQDLPSMMQERRFRRDLYYRLNEFSIPVPSLRERQEDIIFLAKQFLELTNEELCKDVIGFSDDALERLLSYEWPGNVRELRNVIRRAVLGADAHIRAADLGIADAASTSPSHPFDLGRSLDGTQSLKQLVRSRTSELEKEVIARVLKQTGGNRAKAARILQIDYKTLYKKIREHGISAAF
jgi:two-component system nitrogen regulation response regulator GlnG